MEGTAQPALTTMRRLGGAAVLAIPPPTLSDRRAPIAAALVLLALLALTTPAARRLLARRGRRAPTTTGGSPPPTGADPSPAGPGSPGAPARADQTRAHGNQTRARADQTLARGGGPYREGSPGAAEAVSWFPQPPPQPHPHPDPELADLARRSQELLDEQLELLDQVERDQGDPRLAARLLQVDRLAVRARRNARNLNVLAGGKPGRRWEGSAHLAEVVAVAVMDNPDTGRVELDVAGDLLVPREAADDLASVLAELVDNATAFSAPETRVRVRGQRVASGYVLEVEDHGLGMTDGELEAVNRLLAGDPAALDDPGQRLGARVARRLAARHDIRVRLRRSPGGGVTALVLLPESLVVPPRPYGFRVPEADPPLPRRAPHASLAPDLAAADPGRGEQASPPAARSPEQVRSMLSRYRSGLERGRAEAARDLPDDPDTDPTL